MSMSVMMHSKLHLRTGFTLVEIMIVIVVMAVLVGISTFGATKYQQISRDSEREAKASVIASSLEKYYQQNNEYPNCTLLTTTASAVKSNTLTNLADPSILKAPLAASGANSLKCDADISPTDTSDSFVYTCTNTTTFCEEWKLKYRNEFDGSIASISSAHTATGVPTLGAPTISLSAVLSGQNGVATASATCPSGTVEYQIHNYRNAGSFPGTWTDASTSTVSALAEGEGASFEARARCVQAGYTSSNYKLSSVATVDRAVTAPTGLTMTAAVSGSNATGTIGGGSCISPTVLKRQIRSNTTNIAYGGTWTSFADIATTTQTLPINEGWAYSFQQQAQCVNTTTNVASSWTQSGYANAVRPISTIAAPTVSAAGTSSNISFLWGGAATCPTGTSKQYQYQLRGDWPANAYNPSGYYGPVTTTSYVWSDSSQGYTFYLDVQVRCHSDFTDGAWSSTGTASYMRDVVTPNQPSGFTKDTAGTGGIAFSWNSPTCGTGTGPQYRLDFTNGGGTGIKWISAPSGREDGWWFGSAGISISGANPSTAWVDAWGSSYGYMGDRNNPYSVIPPRMDLGADTAFGSNNQIGIAVQYRCRNSTTGVPSSPGNVNGMVYTWP